MSAVAKPHSSPLRSSITELSIFIAAAPSTPERRKRSSMATASSLSAAASLPAPMPSDSMTHSTPESVLKYVPLSPFTLSPRFFHRRYAH